MMNIFENVMLPVILIFASGFIFKIKTQMAIKPLSNIAIYLLLPFLVFQTFYKYSINSKFVTIIIVTSIILILLIIIGVVFSRFWGLDQDERDAFLLSICFPNSGNFGIPIIMFAFGSKELQYGMAIMIFHNILMGTVGIYVASDKSSGIRKPLTNIFKQPMNYVILPAILLNKCNVVVPNFLMKSVNLIGNATIPIIMLVLGMQLAEIHFQKVDWRTAGWACLFRLVISPLIAYFIATMLMLSYSMMVVLVLMSAMPSAANTTLYAIEFDKKPQYVSICTLVSTIFSVVTITMILNWMI
ncbi:MAG: AEC family transporter [Liquorilactobacillus sp.]|uniref:AEC family transporter n=1 Tax=Liquorilactobacillus sp. TaxID=2767923 RepID=UPI0039E76ACB